MMIIILLITMPFCTVSSTDSEWQYYWKKKSHEVTTTQRKAFCLMITRKVKTQDSTKISHLPILLYLPKLQAVQWLPEESPGDQLVSPTWCVHENVGNQKSEGKKQSDVILYH